MCFRAVDTHDGELFCLYCIAYVVCSLGYTVLYVSIGIEIVSNSESW